MSWPLARVKTRQLLERLRLVPELMHAITRDNVTECPRCAWLNRVWHKGKDSPVLCDLFAFSPRSPTQMIFLTDGTPMGIETGTEEAI